jgi:hypothetical protein
MRLTLTRETQVKGNKQQTYKLFFITCARAVVIIVANFYLQHNKLTHTALCVFLDARLFT